MGIRELQWVGLHERVRALVAGEQVLAYTERVVRVYPDGREEPQADRLVMASTVRCDQSGEVYADPFAGDLDGDEEGSKSGVHLNRYTFPDGRVLVEKVQADPWSSGPVVFTALQDESGKWIPESLWSEQEIQANT